MGHPVANDSGDPGEYIGTVMDVSEPHQARAALEKAFEGYAAALLDEARQGASKHKGEFGEIEVKLSAELLQSRRLHRHAAEMLRGAIRAATGAIPGPAHLEMPSDMLRAETADVLIYKEPPFGHIPSLRTAPPLEAVTA